MPIELTWLLPDKILLSNWTNSISEDDMRVLMEELNIILDNAHEVTHTVIDLSAVKHISSGAIYLYVGSRVAQHPKRGRICVVNPTFESEVLADLVNRIAQREMVRLFDTRDEAREFLQHHDSPPPTLTQPPLPSKPDAPAPEAPDSTP